MAAICWRTEWSIAWLRSSSTAPSSLLLSDKKEKSAISFFLSFDREEKELRIIGFLLKLGFLLVVVEHFTEMAV